MSQNSIYRGKRLADMTREELIAAVSELGSMYKQALKDSHDYIEAIDPVKYLNPKGR